MEKTFKEHQSEASRARWGKMSKEERSEQMRKAVQKRWEGHVKRNGSAVGGTNSKSTSAPA